MNIRELICTIKKRPGMFLKEKKLEYIYYLILGYCGANKDKENDNLNKNFSSWFWKWLHLWIEENIDKNYISDSSYWYDDIKKIANNNEHEMDIFFQLCDLFFQDYDRKTGYFKWRNK